MTKLADELKSLAEKVHTAAEDSNNLRRHTRGFTLQNSVIDYAIDYASGVKLDEWIEREIADYREQFNRPPQSPKEPDKYIHLLEASYHLVIAAEHAKEYDLLIETGRGQSARIRNHKIGFDEHARKVREALDEFQASA